MVELIFALQARVCNVVVFESKQPENQIVSRAIFTHMLFKHGQNPRTVEKKRKHVTITRGCKHT